MLCRPYAAKTQQTVPSKAGGASIFHGYGERVNDVKTIKRFSDLEGLTIERFFNPTGEGLFGFVLADGREVVLGHDQDCCESVWLDDQCGDTTDLIGLPLTSAWVNEEAGESEWGSKTWSFYTLATFAGSVTLRFCGESNGYYSESVDMWVDGKRSWEW